MGRIPEPFPAAEQFGARVRQRRTELGWSQEKLGQVAGMHFTYVAQCERGERNVSLRNILKLAVALGVDPGDLVAGLTV